MSSYKDNLTPVRVHVYESDAVVEYKQRFPPVAGPPERGEIRELSYKSRRRLAFVASNTAVNFRTMITLTYPAEFPGDGRTVKANLKAFLDRLRKRDAIGEYLWFMEFQERGAPHIHILSERDYVLPRGDIAGIWYDIVGSGDAFHLSAGTRVESNRQGRRGLSRYAVKYAMKTEQKLVPEGFRNVGRFWGHSRAVKPSPLGSVTLDGGGDSLEDLLIHWEHLDRLRENPYGILFGAGPEIIKRVVEKGMDNE